jgi:hypothetical protein
MMEKNLPNLWLLLSKESKGDEEEKQKKALQKPAGVDGQEKRSAVDQGNKVLLPSSRRQKAGKHQEFQELREATGNKIQTR